MSRRKAHHGPCPTYKSHSTWLIPVKECDFCKGYAAALSSAVDAVEALIPDWALNARSHLVPVGQVVAAIESLEKRP